MDVDTQTTLVKDLYLVDRVSETKFEGIDNGQEDFSDTGKTRLVTPHLWNKGARQRL